MPVRDKFVPYAENAEVVDSLLEVPLDDHDPDKDGDDSQVPAVAPGPVRRLLERVNRRG